METVERRKRDYGYTMISVKHQTREVLKALKEQNKLTYDALLNKMIEKFVAST